MGATSLEPAARIWIAGSVLPISCGNGHHTLYTGRPRNLREGPRNLLPTVQLLSSLSMYTVLLYASWCLLKSKPPAIQHHSSG
eukprot:1389594-Amphidinium_carterae.1